MKAEEGVGVELGGADMDGVETGGVETDEEGWESPGRGVGSVFTAASVAQSRKERSAARAGALSRIVGNAACHSGDGATAQPPPTK
jgi:hypothetical protein